MSDLQRRPTGRLTPTTPGTPLAGGGDLTAGEWTGEVLTPAQMGVRWRVPDRDRVTDMAFQEAGARRRADETLYRRRQAWLAERSGVHVAQSVRSLAPLPDGRFSTVGDWSPPVYRYLAAGAEPARRVGDVAVDRTGSDPSAARGDAPAASAAQLAASYLPAAVRAGLATRANPATLFCGQAVRFTRPDGSVYWQVKLLKLNDVDAVAVLASLQQGAPAWQIEQVSYRFGEVRAADLATKAQ